MTFPSAEEVAAVKERYPAGTRVRLISMDDPYTKLQPGDEGTVQMVDDAGTIHVSWDAGSSLGLVYGEDNFETIEEPQEELE